MISLTAEYITQMDTEITRIRAPEYFLVYHQHTRLFLKGQAVFTKSIKLIIQINGSVQKTPRIFHQNVIVALLVSKPNMYKLMTQHSIHEALWWFIWKALIWVLSRTQLPEGIVKS